MGSRLRCRSSRLARSSIVSYLSARGRFGDEEADGSDALQGRIGRLSRCRGRAKACWDPSCTEYLSSSSTNESLREEKEAGFRGGESLVSQPSPILSFSARLCYKTAS